MKVTIIAIGDEILLGQVTDTNSGMLARKMAPYGWEVNEVLTIADDAEAITEAIEHALGSTQVVLTTGGLGPTADDITKPTLCKIFGGGLHFDESVLENVKNVMHSRGRALNKLTEGQAMVPDAAKIIQNRVGTAPLLWFEREGKVLVSMPGVPFETEEMFGSEVLPRLLKHFENDIVTTHTTLIEAGVSESALAEHLAEFEAKLNPCLHLAYLPKPGIIRLRLDGKLNDGEKLNKIAHEAAEELKDLTKEWLICDEDLPTAAILLNILKERGLTIGTAESCTGGNIAHEITLIAGSSEAMKGGVVAYSNEVKRNILGVDRATLEKHGAVSIPVVEQMAAGARRSLGCDIAVATSGIAGPGGATEGKPVGTVCVAIAGPGERMMSTTLHLHGKRGLIIERATSEVFLAAIKILREAE
ncbi:MAG: CinA family nicotinamide mononucleotide deamidase-related protein [Bacteroides sp.]|nr:CinA family nicotinamide mononucleotide deamidase-related protein [Bacteroides sp.]